MINPNERKTNIRDVSDVLELIGGKWRGSIIAYLCESPRRFSELKAELKGITPRILTKELRYLEMNKIVYLKRGTHSGNSSVYGLTEHGLSIGPMMEEINKWAIKHRKIVLGKD